MRKVVLKMHSSLDGFVLGPGGDLDWAFETFDQEMAEWEVAGLWEAGVHVMGRATYHEMAEHWPSSTEPYAPPMNEIPKVIFSKTLEQADWTGSRIVRGDLTDEMNALRAEDGKHILVHGGATFAQALVEADLIDEYRLVVHPVALGDGAALFPRKVDLKRVELRAFPAGAMGLVFRRSTNGAAAGG
jgi:dihydrofolate reductase